MVGEAVWFWHRYASPERLVPHPALVLQTYAPPAEADGSDSPPAPLLTLSVVRGDRLELQSAVACSPEPRAGHWTRPDPRWSQAVTMTPARSGPSLSLVPHPRQGQRVTYWTWPATTPSTLGPTELRPQTARIAGGQGDVVDLDLVDRSDRTQGKVYGVPRAVRPEDGVWTEAGVGR
jgi:hypothetical protein